MILFIQHVDIEGPDTLGMFFTDMGYDVAVCDLSRGDPLPNDLSLLDAVVSLGGPMNVYEEEQYPFLREEDVFLKEVIRQRMPFLGICLGSQLLSKACGGKVIASPGAEIGWFNIKLTEEGRRDPLFAGWPNKMEVYQWHGDMCLPPGNAVLLATSERCPIQAFRYGPNAYGVQFHIEITDQSISSWVLRYAPGTDIDRDAMHRCYKAVKQDFHNYGRMMCRNFVEIMKAGG